MNKNKQEYKRNWSFNEDASEIVFNYKLSSIEFNITLPSDVIFYPSRISESPVGNANGLTPFVDELRSFRLGLRFGSAIMENQIYNVQTALIDLILSNLSTSDKVLYLMQNQDGLIKIGISNDPEYRRRTLERDLSDDIEIIKTLGFQQYERKLHKLFNSYNAKYKGGREWFTPYPELLKWVDKVNDDNFEKLYNELCHKKLNIQKKN